MIIPATPGMFPSGTHYWIIGTSSSKWFQGAFLMARCKCKLNVAMETAFVHIFVPPTLSGVLHSLTMAQMMKLISNYVKLRISRLLWHFHPFPHLSLNPTNPTNPAFYHSCQPINPAIHGRWKIDDYFPLTLSQDTLINSRKFVCVMVAPEPVGTHTSS